jgi:Skp family chaperone for outer membrane proteins
MRTTIATFALAAMAGCAQSPDSIAPVSMGNAFAAMDCRQAQAELITERQNLAALSAQQQSAVAGDAIGVFLIGVPMSSLTGGDKAGLIAASKGKINALQARGC